MIMFQTKLFLNAVFKKNAVFAFNFCALVEEKRTECRGKESPYDGNIF